jgi:hypothetical protein
MARHTALHAGISYADVQKAAVLTAAECGKSVSFSR